MWHDLGAFQHSDVFLSSLFSLLLSLKDDKFDFSSLKEEF